MKTKFSYYASIVWIAILAIVGIAILAIAPKGKLRSDTENRYLQEFPTPSFESIENGEFTGNFERFMADKFFGRDSIISFAADIKAVFSILDYNDLLEFGDGAEDSFVDETLAEQHNKTESDDSSAETTDEAEKDIEEDTDEALQDDDTSTSALSIWSETPDGGITQYLTVSRPDVDRTADIVNRFANTLPEGGNVLFLNVLQAWHTNKYINSRDQFIGWDSNIHLYMQEKVNSNVHVFSITDIMQEPINNGEYVYFRTDTHWTPLGAYYAYSTMVSSLGITPIPYEAYSFERLDNFLGVYYDMYHSEAMKNQADQLDVISPLIPVRYYFCCDKDTYVERDLINRSMGVMHAIYLGGTGKGLSVLRSQAGTGRNGLVIIDSFGLIPSVYLSAHYDELYVIDPRHFTEEIVGYSVSQLIDMHDIEDIYFFVSDINGHGKDFTTIYTNRLIEG